MTWRLVCDARSLVCRVFRGLEEFSCLAGSSVTGASTTTSDIDIVVVLPDEVPLDRAIAARDKFTGGYVRLHHEYGRRPDLTFPGEVLFRSDLTAGVQGRCFAPGSSGREWCAESEPYRFWVSMIGTGLPLTGSTVFRAASDHCAAVIAAVVGLRSDPGRALEEIGIDATTIARCPRLDRSLTTPAVRGFPSATGPGWRCPLEARWGRWRRIADAEWCRAADRG